MREDCVLAAIIGRLTGASPLSTITAMNAHSETGPLPLFGIGALVFFYSVWACMHDIAHGDEGTGEWTVLAICALVFPFLYWSALRVLAGKARLMWLIALGLLFGLFNAGALSSVLHPKYAKDPMLGKTFLIGGVPILCVICYNFAREMRRRRARA